LREKEINNKSKGGQTANLLGKVQTIDEDLDKDNNNANINIIIKRRNQAIANDNTFY